MSNVSFVLREPQRWGVEAGRETLHEGRCRLLVALSTLLTYPARISGATSGATAAPSTAT
eukprot:CAMPEP_0172070598 /NCGR_PEP_ID=MMETSP1043-20130122/13348_1 /TAXON_ID=464988 /ORGANISM="Hemiselmis andersenii, Strain CCMP441" /LENGTH=59 /DNA_ID=CAMNT_0012730971 /DNA_START=127 /DNA_END=303 /DNA_ORIENTATION=+